MSIEGFIEFGMCPDGTIWGKIIEGDKWEVARMSCEYGATPDDHDPGPDFPEIGEEIVNHLNNVFRLRN